MKKALGILKKYVDAATTLAESVRRNIAHNGTIDNETVNHLNTFIIASNEIADLPIYLTDDDDTGNNTIN